MNRKDSLFELIKSMTRTEKRYFRIHFINHTIKGKSDFVEIFDTLNAQLDYNEKKLKWSFQKGLSTKKKHLYEVLMKSLRAYHANHSGQIQFYNLMTDIVILSEKGLIKQAEKRLKKAESLAKSYSLSLELLTINRLKRKFLRQKTSKKKLPILISFHEEGNCLLESFRLETTVLNHYERLLWAERTNQVEEIQVQLDQAIALVSELHNTSKLSVRSRLCIHMIYIFYYTHVQDIENAFKHRSILLNMFEEEYPILIEEHYKQYLAMIKNYLNDCFALKLLDEAYGKIQILDKIKSKDVYISKQIRMTLLSSWQDYYLNKMDFKAAIDAFHSIQEYLKKNRELVNDLQKLIYCYNGLVAYFLEATLNTKDKEKSIILFDNALNIIVFIEQTKEFDPYPDYILRTKILAAIIRLELGENEYANSILIRAKVKIPRISKNKILLVRLLIKYIKSLQQPQYLNKIHEVCNVQKWMEELHFWIEKKIL